MTHSFRHRPRQSQDGAVAVEAAVCIAFILAPLIFVVFLFGRFFWHYTVVHKALHDAALYMAKAPLDEIKSGGATGLVNYILERETADLDSGTQLESWSQCGYRVNTTSFNVRFAACDRATAPFSVQTNTFMTVRDPLYFKNGGSGEIQFLLTSTMRYAGK